MKKLISLFLAMVMALSLVACSGGGAPASGMQKLADTLKADGEFYPDSQFYAFSQSQSDDENGECLAAICYKPAENELNFICSFESTDGTTSVLGFDYLLDDKEVSEVRLSFESSVGDLSGVASLDMASYTENSTLQFTAPDGSSLLEEFTPYGNSVFKLGALFWSKILANNTDLTMADIGFTSY